MTPSATTDGLAPSRLICLVHYKLAGTVHSGIQAAHAMGRVIARYPESDPANAILWDWLRAHETMIVKNGGSSRTLAESLAFLQQLPWDGAWPGFPKLLVADFRESQDDMEGLRTAIALVVPDALSHPDAEDVAGMGAQVQAAMDARRGKSLPTGWGDLAGDVSLPSALRLHAFLRQFPLA